MLVLSRKNGEQIVIDNKIVVTVVNCGNGRVRLGVECDREIPVHRKEIWDSLQPPENGETPLN